MLKSFRRRPRRRESMGVVWEKLGEEGKALRRIVGERLKKVVDRLTTRQKWLFVGGTMAAVAVGSIYCIVLGATGSGRHIEVGRIAIPAHVRAGPPVPGDDMHHFGRNQLEQLEKLERYADSLQGSGSAGYDSVLKSDPNFEKELGELKSILKQYNSK